MTSELSPDALADAAAGLLERCTFPPSGTAVVCAFSGGADSTALLALAVAAGCRVSAVHVDHGLRPTSGDEARQAVELGARLGVAVTVVPVAVGDGPNLEARARAARRAVLPPGHLTGHTADDQAETLLVNLLRGAGVDGLAAMAPGPSRPLLALRRRETRELCARLALNPVADPSNREPRFLRNRIRHELLPLLDDLAGRDVAAILARTAAIVREDAELLADVAGGIDPTDARAVAAADPALARRALRAWLTLDGYPPDRAAVDRVYEVATGRRRACEVHGGRRVQRSGGRLSIVPPAQIVSVDGVDDVD